QALDDTSASRTAVASTSSERQVATEPRSTTATVESPPKPKPGFLRPQLGRWKQRLARLKPSRSRRPESLKLAEAKQASERKDWERAEALWQEVLEGEHRAPAVYYRRLARACRQQGNLRKAEKIVHEGLLRYPGHLELNLDLVEIAIADRDWPLASSSAGAILETFEREPELVVNNQLTLALEALLGNREYARTYAVLNAAKARGRSGKSLLAIEGLAHLRSGRIDDARRHWHEYWQRAREDAHFAAEPHATRRY